MIKAAFFDIDGTILDHEGGKSIFHKSTEAALAALQRKGIKVFVSTGRGFGLLGDIRGMFPFDGFVTFNGQLVVERDGTVMHRMAHDTEDIRAMVPLIREAGFSGFVHEETASWPILDSLRVRKHFEWLKKEMPPMYDLDRAGELPVLQVTLYEAAETVMKVFGDKVKAEVVACGPGMVDVIPVGGGKERGLSAVTEHYGFTREETAAFGDSMNDLGMIKWAGIGVAMGNAEPEVKAAADMVTTSVSEDGAANALIKLGVLTKADVYKT